MGLHKVLAVRYRMADPVAHNKINLLGCLKPWWCGFQTSSLSLLLLPLCLLFSPSITVHHCGILPRALLGGSWQHISQLRALQEHCSSLLKLHPLKYAAFRIIFPHSECLRLYKTQQHRQLQLNPEAFVDWGCDPAPVALVKAFMILADNQLVQLLEWTGLCWAGCSLWMMCLSSREDELQQTEQQVTTVWSQFPNGVRASCNCASVRVHLLQHLLN